MNRKRIVIMSLAALPIIGWAAIARPGWGDTRGASGQGASFAATVRAATERFKDVEAAKAAGYGLLHGCVAGPQEGAMGVHYVNGDLVGDGALDPNRPEALIYEFHNGQPALVGVEYIVPAEAWNAGHDAPPVLMGQLFQYNSSPNRYGIPAFYELHVWAWKSNPSGTFADWNPTVSCDDYVTTAAEHDGHH